MYIITKNNLSLKNRTKSTLLYIDKCLFLTIFYMKKKVLKMEDKYKNLLKRERQILKEVDDLKKILIKDLKQEMKKLEFEKYKIAGSQMKDEMFIFFKQNVEENTKYYYNKDFRFCGLTRDRIITDIYGAMAVLPFMNTDLCDLIFVLEKVKTFNSKFQ